MRRCWTYNCSWFVVGIFLLMSVVAHADGTARIPPTECMAWVGYDRDAFLPGYLIPTAPGKTSCVPFTQTAVQPPAGYMGADFYVDEFTDSKLRERWWKCMEEPECRDRIVPHVKRRAPPGRDHAVTDPHKVRLLGKIDAENPHVDLNSIRRPAFFAADPWREEIATAEDRTFTIELTVEPEPHERIVRHRTKDVKLRGWYLQGEGIDDGQGGKTRALIIISAGGGGRLVAITHPLERLYNIDPATGNSVVNSYPNEFSGASSQRHWRQLLLVLNNAGFDVLSYDRRGAGVSGGYGDTNTLQQGRDLLTNVANLNSGKGMRVLSPGGVEYAGPEASAALLAGADGARLPIVLAGISRGTMASGWAMTRNFYRSCDYDLEDMPCGPPLNISNIKGAMMIAGYTSGVGYVTTPTTQDDMDRGLFIAGTELEEHVVFHPSSGILAGVHTWPALFIGRGLWDYAESLEGSVAAYDRVAGLKELLVVRGPHPFETWPESERARTASRMIAFAGAAVRGQETAPGARTWTNLKELVATASNVWETSSFPHPVPGGSADDQLEQGRRLD